MIDAKKGKVSLYVEQSKLYSEAAVNLSFKCKLSCCTLNRLNGGSNCCECFPIGSEQSCVAFAQYLVVKNALCGNPLLASKSKVSSVGCGSHNDEFFITWRVKATGSAIRKSIGIALKNLNPVKLYTIYARLVKEVGGKAKKEEFEYASNELASSMKDVTVLVIGNMKGDKEVVSNMVDVLEKKLDPQTVKGGSKPNEHVNCDHSSHVELKVTGWKALVIHDYIMAKARGIVPMVCEKGLLIPLKQPQWDTISGKIKKQTKDYTNLSYKRVEDNLGAILGHMATSNCILGANDILSMIRAKLKAGDVERAINDGLK